MTFLSVSGWYGTRSNEVMPFCGQYSAKNPRNLYYGDWQTDLDGSNGRWTETISRSTPVVSA